MIQNPLPRRNVHLRKRPAIRPRFLVLLVLSLAVLLASRLPLPSSPGKDIPQGTELAGQETESGPVGGDAEIPVKVGEYRVRRGDTLLGILSDAGVAEAEILSVARSRIDGINPSRIVAGRDYRLYTRDDQVVEYQYEPDEEKVVRVLFGGEEPVLTVEPIPYEVKRVPLSGIIEDSLFAAVEAIGEKPSLAMDLADIFAWQVDFFRDLRKGDSFRVLVDKYYRDGEFVRYGKPLAAEFVNSGSRYQAFLYQPAQGREDYFDEAGGSLRKQFLKAPLKFRRISSGFSRRRLHPLTGRVVAHLGVDYAAQTGTPIMAIGDGKVVMKKYDSVNGRIVKIRHNSVYSSAYAHMNSFASGIQLGSSVRQGQIIGYVGRTGRATGPHLHFAMYRNDRYVDPRAVSVPRASSVPEQQMDQFMALAAERYAELLAVTADRLAGDTESREDVVR